MSYRYPKKCFCTRRNGCKLFVNKNLNRVSCYACDKWQIIDVPSLSLTVSEPGTGFDQPQIPIVQACWQSAQKLQPDLQAGTCHELAIFCDLFVWPLWRNCKGVDCVAIGCPRL